jgi:hypothetical protein
MKLDLRDRCKRCRKVPRSKIQKDNYVRYPGYCSYHCQEWHCLELASEFVRSMPAYLK